MSRAFTLVELLVCIVVIVVLIALVSPALARVRAAAANTKCLSNLSQIARAVQAFRLQNRDHLPALLSELDLPNAVWQCPKARDGYSAYMVQAPPDLLGHPSNHAAWSNVIDARDCAQTAWYAADPTAILHGWQNAGFLDGHAGRMAN